jgi:hypothetical protein
MVEQPPADPLPRLQHQRPHSRPNQLPRRNQPSQPGAHDRDVGLELLGHQAQDRSFH